MIKKVAKHIHRDVDDDVIVKVAANLTLEAMKLNYGKTMETRKKLNLTEEPSPLHLFVRKGKTMHFFVSLFCGTAIT